jgi:hypothetical protein
VNWRERKKLKDDAAVAALAQRRAPKVKTAEDFIWPMPTVDEVVARGYPAAYWDTIKAERDRFIEKWNTDPVFRAEAEQRFAAEHAAMRKRDEDEAAFERDYQRQRRSGRIKP